MSGPPGGAREATGIQLSGLSRRFGAVEAVRDLTLEIDTGETLGLLGPNGAGKTTALGMLSTLIQPTSGDACLFGRSLCGDPAGVRRLVGLAPQEISLYPDLSGDENLRFFGRIHGVAGPRLDAKVGELLEIVGLSARKDDRVATYSGGMKRRLNLACSLVHEPQLLLADEPTVGVDPQSREALLVAIQRIAATGTTVIYSTHYMEEAERLCDRIAILDEGRLAALGSLGELLEIVGMGEVIELRGWGASAELERLPGFVKIEREVACVRIFVKNAALALPDLTPLLRRADPPGDTTLQVYPVNLERVFMHLTGRALRD